MTRWQMSLMVFGIVLGLLAAGFGWSDDRPQASDRQRREELRELELRARMQRHPEALWDDLVQFRQKYAGTPEAFAAAGLMAQVPSPLDNLRASDIPEQERFAWQPPGLVAVIGEHRGRHWGGVYQIAFLPDGKRILSAGGGGTRIWDAGTLREQSWICASRWALAPDGKSLAAAGTHLQLWDISEAKPKKYAELKSPVPKKYEDWHVRHPEGSFNAIAWSPDGKTLATVTGDDQAIRLWEIQGDRILPRKVISIKGRDAQNLLFVAGGNRLVVDQGGEIRQLWDLTGDEPTLAAQVSFGSALALLPDGKTVASTGRRGISFRDLSGAADQEEVLDLPPTLSRWSLAFSPDGKLVAAVCMGNKRERNKLELIPLEVAKKNGPAQRPQGYALMDVGFSLSRATFSPDGQTLVLGGEDGTVRLWSLADKKEKMPLTGLTGAVYSVAISPDCKTLATAHADKRIRLWGLAEREWQELQAVEADAGMLKFALSGRALLSAWHDDGPGAVRLWELRGGRAKQKASWQAYTDRLCSLTVSADGRTLLTTGADKMGREEDRDPGRQAVTRLWDLTGNEPHLTYAIYPAVNQPREGDWPDNFDKVEDGDINPDGKWVALKVGRTVRLYDISGDQPKEREQVRAYNLALHCLAFAPDGKTLVTCGTSEPLVDGPKTASTDFYFWDVTGPKVKAVSKVREDDLRKSIYAPNVLAYAPNGKWFLTWCHWSRELRVRDAKTGKELYACDFPAPPAVSIAEDSRHLFVANRNGTVYVIRLPLDRKP